MNELAKNLPPRFKDGDEHRKHLNQSTGNTARKSIGEMPVINNIQRVTSHHPTMSMEAGTMADGSRPVQAFLFD